jgi:hypothetical protein
MQLNCFSEWDILKYGDLQESILGTSLFIIYINDLPLRTNSISKPITFADDTGVTISSKHFYDFCIASNLILSHKGTTFAPTKLVVNLD